MTSKARELLLELYLLSLRYSLADLKEISQLDESVTDPFLKGVIHTLEKIGPGTMRGRGRRVTPRIRSSSELTLSNKDDLAAVLDLFINRVVRKKVLKSDQELFKFMQSVGVNQVDTTARSESGNAIRAALGALPKKDALQKIRAAERLPTSDSAAFVELATTIMKGRS